MTSRDFCYWLQGFFEVAGAGTDHGATLNTFQVDMEQRHLNLVFKHEIDPSMGNEKHQQELNQIHNKPKPPDYSTTVHGPCPHEGWVLSALHGWYDPKEGTPRC